MYGYAANSAATTAKVTPFTAAPQTTNRPGRPRRRRSRPGRRHVDWRGRAVNAVEADLHVPTSLQSLASPAASSTSGLSGILNGFWVGSSTAAHDHGRDFVTWASGFSLDHHGGVITIRRASSGLVHGARPVGPWGPLWVRYESCLHSGRRSQQHAAAAGAAGAAAAGGALRPWAARPAVLPAWAVSRAWARRPRSAHWRCRRVGAGPRRPPAARRHAVGDAVAGRSGAAGGLPLAAGLPGGMGRAAGLAAAAGVGGAVASKYAPRLKVLARSPGAGYSETPMAPAGRTGCLPDSRRPPDTRRTSCTCPTTATATGTTDITGTATTAHNGHNGS